MQTVLITTSYDRKSLKATKKQVEGKSTLEVKELAKMLYEKYKAQQ